MQTKHKSEIANSQPIRAIELESKEHTIGKSRGFRRVSFSSSGAIQTTWLRRRREAKDEDEDTELGGTEGDCFLQLQVGDTLSVERLCDAIISLLRFEFQLGYFAFQLSVSAANKGQPPHPQRSYLNSTCENLILFFILFFSIFVVLVWTD